MQNLAVIYEDNHLIAVNKPVNTLVHSDYTGDYTLEEAVKKYIKERYNKPGDVYLGVLHRLDRMVSGVLIFARTSKAAQRMSKMIQEQSIEKIYYALSENTPAEMEGTLKHYLIKDNEKNKVRATDHEKPGSKLAVLDYSFVANLERYALIKVQLKSGRPHQIRVQLKKINCPIVGDSKYGSNLETSDRSLGLHCRSMSFVHPVTKESITIRADFPRAPWWRLFEDVVEEIENSMD
jgi:23S rRNA pseudouridine1911/1915/1917 synthase